VQNVNAHCEFVLVAISESFLFDGSLPQLLVKPVRALLYSCYTWIQTHIKVG